MSIQTIAAVNAAVRESLIPVLEDGNEKKATTYNMFPFGEGEINARGMFLSILADDHAIERTTTVEGGAFPDGDATGWIKPNLPLVKIERTILMSGAVKRNNNKNQLNINVVRRNFTNAMDMTYKSQNRYAFGDGSGEQARIGGGTVGAGGTAVDTTTKRIYCNGATNLYGVRWLKKNQQLEARAADGTRRVGGGIIKMTVTKVSRKQGDDYIEVDQLPTDIAAGDLLVNYDSYGTAPLGFDYHCGISGQWLGLNRGVTNPVLNGVRRSNGGEKLTGGALDQLIGDMTFKLGEEPRKDGREIIWAPTQQNSYKDEGYRLKQFVLTVGQTARGSAIDMGFEECSHNGMKSRVDVDCQIDRVVIHTIGAVKKYALQRIQILQDDGGPIRLQVGALGYYDAYVGFIQGEQNTATETPWDAIAILENLAYDGYSNGRIA
jgi:hypothetical protein